MIPMGPYLSQPQQLQSECQYAITVMIMDLSRRYRFLLRKLEVEFYIFSWKLFSVFYRFIFSFFGGGGGLSETCQKTADKITLAVTAVLTAKSLPQYLWAGFWEHLPMKPYCYHYIFFIFSSSSWRNKHIWLLWRMNKYNTFFFKFFFTIAISVACNSKSCAVDISIS